MITLRNIRLRVTRHELLIFLAFIVASCIFIGYNWRRIQESRTKEILHLARTVETLIPKQLLSSLSASAEDTSKVEYAKIKQSLMSVIKVNPNARFAYIYKCKENKLYFCVDSEPATSKDYSPPGQEYSEATPTDFEPIYKKTEIVTEATTDRWGTWISALIPIKDEQTGEIVAVFGMDFNAKKWNQSIIFEILQSSVLVFLLVISLLSLIFAKRKSKTLSSEIDVRHEVESALWKSENQKEAILHALPDLIFVFNRNGDYIDIYTEDETMLVYPKEQLKGMNIKDIFPTQTANLAIEAIHEAFENNTVIQFSYDLLIKNTQYFFEARIVPSIGENVLSIVRDITERKQNELLSQERQERIGRQRNAISRIAVNEELPSVGLNSMYKIVAVEAANALDVERTSIWILSDDKSELHCVALYEKSQQKHSSGEVLKYENYPIYFDTIRKESRISSNDAQNDSRTAEFKESYLIPLNITSMLDACIYIGGVLKGIVCFEHIGQPKTWHSDEETFANTFASIIAQFITNDQRKQAENVLLDIIEKNPISIQIIDKKGFTLNYNAAYLNLFRTTPPTNTSVFDDCQLKNENFAELLDQVQKGEVVYFPDMNCQIRDTNPKHPSDSVWIQMVIFPLKDSDGIPEKYVLMHENISRRKIAEQELIIAKEHAEESDRLKSAFLANMSHEIRTPMNGILGFTELLKQPSLSGETQQEYIRIIQESGERMLNIINNIVDISKIEAKLMDLTLSPSNINQQLDFIFNFFKPEVEKKGMTLLLKKELKNHNATIKTDTEKVYAILTNLVKNAIKYSTQGVIEFGCRELEGNELLFFVKDSGIGIPEEMREAIFERFIQANHNMKTLTQGAGLGLAITKAYVEMLGGKIWVESNDNNYGSAFYFTLPYQPMTDHTPDNTRKPDTDQKTNTNNLKILIAEDDETSGKLIEMVMRKYAQEIIRARNGEEAVNECKSHPDLDLILMDIQMPLMNGYEATKAIREFNAEVIIIAQTANAMADDKEKAMQNGFNDYIAKPIDKIKIDAFITKYFSRI